MTKAWGMPSPILTICALIAALTSGCALAPRPSMALRDMVTHQPAYASKISAGLSLQNLYNEFAVAPDLRFVHAPTENTAWSMSLSTAAVSEERSATSGHEPRHYTARLLGRFEPSRYERFALIGGLGGGWTDNGAIFASADAGLVAILWKESFVEYHVGLLGGASWMIAQGDPVVLATPAATIAPYLPVSSYRLGPTFGFGANIGQTGRVALEFITQGEGTFDDVRDGGSYGFDISVSVGF